jgi:hypothetical protein
MRGGYGANTMDWSELRACLSTACLMGDKEGGMNVYKGGVGFML